VQFSELQKPPDLDLDFGSVRGHTDGHMWSRSTYKPNYTVSDKKDATQPPTIISTVVVGLQYFGTNITE